MAMSSQNLITLSNGWMDQTSYHALFVLKRSTVYKHSLALAGLRQIDIENLIIENYNIQTVLDNF